MKKFARMVRFSAVAVLVWSMSACAPSFYIPNELNMPLACNAHTGKATVYTGTGGWGAQGSYTPDSNIVVMADGQYNNFSTLGSNRTYSFNAGLGYYISDTRKGTAANGMAFEGMAGMGYGRADADISFARPLSLDNAREQDILHGAYLRYFLQTDFVKEEGKVDFGLGLRLCYLTPERFDYHVILTWTEQGNAGTPPTTLNIGEDELTFLKNSILLEPGFRFDARLSPHSYYHLSLGASILLNNKDTLRNTDFSLVYWPVICTMGYSYYF